MRATSRSTKLLALLVGMTLFAAACGSDKKDDSSSSTTDANAATTAPVNVPTGGTLLIGAEQEPDCADWMGSCGGSSWGYWMMQVGTMPRAYDVVKENGKYVNKPNSLLTGEPKLETSPKQVVTYKINPKAVWDDGQPITSTDFKYTWDQVVNGNDIYDKTGYQEHRVGRRLESRHRGRDVQDDVRATTSTSSAAASASSRATSCRARIATRS